jgi:hypothetical protein
VSSEQVHTFEGRFLLQNLEPGRRSLQVGAPGFQPHRFDGVWVRAGELVELPPVALHLGYTVSIALLGPKNLPPTAAFTLSIEESEGQGNPPWALVPERKGALHVVGPLRPGRYRLEVTAPGRAPIESEFHVGADMEVLRVPLQ